MARKKKEVKSILRDAPNRIYNAVNRLGEYATMIKINGNEIKAYELEPEFRELTGGSDDYSIAQVTITNNSVNAIPVIIPIVTDQNISQGFIRVSNQSFVNVNVILYKGEAMAALMYHYSVTLNGDIVSGENDSFIITGNGQIIINEETD